MYFMWRRGRNQRMNDKTFGFTVAIGIALTAMTFLLVLQHKAQVHGDDSELCLKHCNDQTLEDLHQALEIWNAANCSTRDICTPVCDPDDEALNITGRCDPDWNDTGDDKS